MKKKINKHKQKLVQILHLWVDGSPRTKKTIFPISLFFTNKNEKLF